MTNTPPMRLLALATIVTGSACTAPPTISVGTPQMRAELFDTILARTERREAWSHIKNQTLGFDPIEAMKALKDDFVSADTDEDLFYAISRLSAARRDRHLSVSLVPGGLQLSDSSGLEVIGGDEMEARVAPVRVFPDFGAEGASYFVGDLANGPVGASLPELGSRVVAVNGVSIADWEIEATRYMRHSTTIGLKWKLAQAMTVATALFPPELRGDGIRLTTQSRDGSERTYELPLSPEGSLAWLGTSEPAYPGFELMHRTVTYDLLVDEMRRIVVLRWTGFRETMVEDVDALMDLAQEQELLDYTMIMDVTRSGGGSRGAYAVQRIQGRPFKTTFGNLRISDVTGPFIDERREAFGRQGFTDGGVRETIDDGSWLMEWLEVDVRPALERGDAYTNSVPFKSAHAPRDSDGVLRPAEVHFRGPFAVISGPDGGSHLDQFIHQVIDNDLGPVVGMPPGGYSNTWEWEEVLTFPGTDQPIAHFMWNIGHTITPNGEIAEGNPAEIDEWIPLTADNFREYYTILLEAALRRLTVM
ncbi:MAG: hypothetical protein O2958_14895 [Gemmatimonadetes bacterium]|nr:hypothetical protein [Gemmatimonadota bacterium]MDA1104418.1 hypothetical protein [Gemmatimonadota bacterium]